MERQPPQWLEVGEDRRRLAFLMQEGEGAPVVWLGGFRSDMRATKAEALADWARDNGRAYLRFDYGGHGESEGDFGDFTLSDWLGDALAMIESRCRQRPVLVGSSMGGWIALLAARKLSGTALQPAGLVLIAPAVDFSEELMWAQMPDSIRRTILDEGVWLRPSEYSPDPTPITRALIEDGRQHLMFGGEIKTRPATSKEWTGVDYANPYADANYRSLGVADMALAIVEGRAHRASGDLALHVLEVMEAFEHSARDGRVVEIRTPVERPAPLGGPVA